MSIALSHQPSREANARLLRSGPKKAMFVGLSRSWPVQSSMMIRGLAAAGLDAQQPVRLEARDHQAAVLVEGETVRNGSRQLDVGLEPPVGERHDPGLHERIDDEQGPVLPHRHAIRVEEPFAGHDGRVTTTGGNRDDAAFALLLARAARVSDVERPVGSEGGIVRRWERAALDARAVVLDLAGRRIGPNHLVLVDHADVNAAVAVHAEADAPAAEVGDDLERPVVRVDAEQLAGLVRGEQLPVRPEGDALTARDGGEYPRRILHDDPRRNRDRSGADCHEVFQLVRRGVLGLAHNLPPS